MPNRTRGEIGGCVHDASVVTHMETRLAKYLYMARGKHRVYGAGSDVPVMKRVVQMAREHQLLLRSHSDAESVERRFKQQLAGAHLYARPRRWPSTR